MADSRLPALTRAHREAQAHADSILEAIERATQTLDTFQQEEDEDG